MKLHELKSIIDTLDMDMYGYEDVTVISVSSDNVKLNNIIAGIASNIAIMAKDSDLETMLQNYVQPDDFVILVPDTMHINL